MKFCIGQLVDIKKGNSVTEVFLHLNGTKGKIIDIAGNQYRVRFLKTRRAFWFDEFDIQPMIICDFMELLDDEAPNISL